VLISSARHQLTLLDQELLHHTVYSAVSLAELHTDGHPSQY